jgi:CheY-like chemotaxis protein
VEPNLDIQGILRQLFAEEGYDACFVSSVQEALPLVDEGMFQLILADVFVGRSRHSFTEAHILRRRALPTPTALMTTQNVLLEEVRREGFAFLMRKPFDLEELLSEIAHALQRPLTPEQQRQAWLVERYFAAVNEREWEALADLCTEDVAYYPPARNAPPAAKKITGKAAFSAYLAYLVRHIPFCIEEELVYARRKGLAARYMIHAVSPESVTEHLAGALLFHFADNHISQIGVSTYHEPLSTRIRHARAG